MADDRTPPLTTEPEPVEEIEENVNDNGHGESSSMASSLGSNLPGTSDTGDKNVNYKLLRGKSRQLHPDTSIDLDGFKSIVNDENGKKKPRNLVICSNCHMHNGFGRRDELPFISYKRPHCNELNGLHKEQKGCDSASTSGEGDLQCQPYNPFSMQEMPRGIFIEEITPNHETTDPEMDPPVMIIRESPSLGGREELPSASTPFTLRKLPTGLSIEEMITNEERTAAEMEPPVMIIPESPAAVTLLMVPEMARGLSIEEISPNEQQIEDHDVIAPVVFVQEPPSASGQVELLSRQNSATVTPVTVPEVPSGVPIIEMTPNQEMIDPEMEPPVMIIRESPSAGAPVMGDSSFVTLLMVQEMARGHSTEEVSPNHQLTENREMDPPVLFVQESTSLGSQELSMITPDPDPAAATSVTVSEMPGFSIEEPSVMIVQEAPSVGGPAAVTPLEVPEVLDDTINPDATWQHFLPPDYSLFLSQAVDPVVYASEEELYFRLCHHPLLIYGGSMSFGLDESSGVKCFMLSARVSIVWGDDERYWKWIARPDSRFSKCAELKEVCWLEIRGRIDRRILTPNTAYAAYLVFKLADNVRGLSYPSQTAEITLAGDTVSKHLVSLWDGPLPEGENEVITGNVRLPNERPDKWLEVELGEFDSGDGIDGEVDMSLMETNNHHWKRGLIVQGIEVRPKH